MELHDIAAELREIENFDLELNAKIVKDFEVILEIREEIRKLLQEALQENSRVFFCYE